MEKAKVIEVLRTFTKQETKQFEKFLSSPYFMQGKDLSSGLLLKSFRWLKTFYPDFNGKNFTKENLFAHLYPSKKYKDESVRYLASTLLKAAEKFLAISEYNNDIFQHEKYLLSTLSSRKLDKMFQHHKNVTEDLVEAEGRNPNYYYKKQAISSLVNNFCIYRKQLLESYDIQKEADSFFSYFIARALELYRNMAIEKSFQNINYNFKFFEDVMKFLRENPEIIKQDFLIAMNYYELMIILEENDEYFYELKKLKDKYIEKLDWFSEHEVYSCLHTYCIKKTNEGLFGFRTEKLKLDAEILERNLHRYSDYIPGNYFIAVCSNSIDMKEYEWAEKFINAYKNRLDPEHAAFELNLVNARLNFSKGEYRRALECLGKINIEYSQQKQQLRNLMLKIYYETNAIDSALSLIDSNRHLLAKDTQLTIRQKKTYRNFIRYLNELIIIKCKPDKRKLLRFKEKLDSSPYFTHKEWLVEKAEELGMNY